MVPLSFAGGHIIDNGEAPSMVQCIFLADSESRLADNDPDLSFVVDGLGEDWMRIYLISVGDCRGPAFGEDDGMRRYVDFV